MPKVPKNPVKVRTPGTYVAPGEGTPARVKTPLNKTKKTKKSPGRPSIRLQKGARRKGLVKHRRSYTEEDLQEAIRLCQVEDYSISSAAAAINAAKKNPVPRHVKHEIIGTYLVPTLLVTVGTGMWVQYCFFHLYGMNW
jgi:hypothetical protein